MKVWLSIVLKHYSKRRNNLISSQFTTTFSRVVCCSCCVNISMHVGKGYVNELFHIQDDAAILWSNCPFSLCNDNYWTSLMNGHFIIQMTTPLSRPMVMNSLENFEGNIYNRFCFPLIIRILTLTRSVMEWE